MHRNPLKGSEGNRKIQKKKKGSYPIIVAAAIKHNLCVTSHHQDSHMLASFPVFKMKYTVFTIQYSN